MLHILMQSASKAKTNPKNSRTNNIRKAPCRGFLVLRGLLYRFMINSGVEEGGLGNSLLLLVGTRGNIGHWVTVVLYRFIQNIVYNMRRLTILLFLLDDD